MCLYFILYSSFSQYNNKFRYNDKTIYSIVCTFIKIIVIWVISLKKKIFNIKFILLGLITGLINGIFGSGGGTILVPGMFFLLKISEHKAHATAISVILPLSIISTVIYLNHGLIVWDIALKIILGGVIGGFIGARLLNKVPGNILRKIFAIFMIIAAIRMVF